MNEIEIFLERESGEKTITLESEGTLILPNLEDLEVTPTKEQQVFNHKNSDGYDNVKVNAIPDEYIIPEGMLPITENATYDVRKYARVSTSVHPAPNLQDKSITITENGTQNISTDDGYDGLGNVEVITNVEATGIPKQDGLKTLIDTINSVLTEFNTSMNNVVNTYTKYYNTPVTLYTPDSYHKYYILRHGATGWSIRWISTNMMLTYSSNMIYPRVYTLRFSNGVITYPDVNASVTHSLTNQKQTVYYSQSYETLEECLQAIQSPNTTYTSGSETGWSTYYENEFDGIFTNLPMSDNSNFLTVRRLSSDETIEVIS